MFVHTVYFWLKEKDNKESSQALLAGLKTLKSVESVHAVYVGKPADTRRPVIDATYDYALTFVFADEQAHDIYQVHPVHTKFVADCAHLWGRVQIYDAVSV